MSLGRALVIGAFWLAASARAADSCDRSCLEGFLDTYVDALTARDPALLPASADVKFTENGQRLRLGDGLWNTATGRGRYALRLTDPDRDQAVLMGTIREADVPTAFVLRLHIADDRIDEAAASRADGTQPGCLEQFESGVFYYVTRIRDRRFVLVDPERGLVFAFAFFDNAAGSSRFGTLADGMQVESGPEIPWTWQIAEVFGIENGLIGPVESVLHSMPCGMGSGWSSWDEAMSSEPRFQSTAMWRPSEIDAIEPGSAAEV